MRKRVEEIVRPKTGKRCSDKNSSVGILQWMKMEKNGDFCLKIPYLFEMSHDESNQLYMDN